MAEGASQRLDTTPTMTGEARSVRRRELEAHLDGSTAYHLEVVYEELTKRLERLERGMDRDRDRESQQSRTSPSSVSLSSASGHGACKAQRLNRLESQVSCCKSTDDCGYSTGSGSASGSAGSEFDSAMAVAAAVALLEPRVAEERARVDLLETGQVQLVEDLTRLVRANELLREEGARANEAVVEYRTVCGDLQRALALTQVSLLAAEEKLAQLQAASFDGELIWAEEEVLFGQNF